MIEWIPVRKEAAKNPCLACDKYGQIFIPQGVLTIRTENGNTHCYDGKGYKFNTEEFLKGEEITLYNGEKARIRPTKIIAWMPLPEPYREDGSK